MEPEPHGRVAVAMQNALHPSQAAPARQVGLPIAIESPATVSEPDAVTIAADLLRLHAGELYADAHHRMLYSTDASLYQVQPLGVVMPKDTAAVETIVDYCARRHIAILPRGGVTSLAGQCTNRALVVDMTPHFRRIMSVDVAGRTCLVEPGIGIDELNQQLEARRTGLFFAPDPATLAQASVGGCIGNNAAGARSIRYGRTSENLEGLEVILSARGRIWLKAGAGAASAMAADLSRRVARVVRDHARDIRQRYPKLIRRNAGYALDSILAQLDACVPDDQLNLAGLICGSEGTLAMITAARLKLCPVPVARGLAVAAFADVEAAIAAVEPILETQPSAVELLDDAVILAAAGNTTCKPYLDRLPLAGKGMPHAVLYVEYEAIETASELDRRFKELTGLLGAAGVKTYTGAREMADAWALRRSSEALLHGLPGNRKPVTFVEDNSVPVGRLGEFVREFKNIVRRHGTQAAFYAHASVGVLHIRPMLDLHSDRDREKMRAIAIEAAALAKNCGGVMSGEHGDGRARGPLLETFYGPELIRAFKQIKEIFDPAGIFNPGMIVDTLPLEGMTSHLRVDAQPGMDNLAKIPTFYRYPGEHGFAQAVELCNGAGFCRRRSGGTMCPSYRATLDERHSTRGRANAIRMAVAGNDTPGRHPNWHDLPTLATLDLCLGCKACRTECPSSVDIAQLKAEYLAQHYRGGDPSAEALLLANYRLFARMGAALPTVVNRLSATAPVRRFLTRRGGMAPQRTLPRFSRSLFQLANRQRRRFSDQSPADERRIVFFGDCFTAYHDSGLGLAAIRVIEKLGYRLHLANAGCCGRVLISNGLLEQAVATIGPTLSFLAALAADSRVEAILVSEPSCFSAMVDDWRKLRHIGPPGTLDAVLEKLMCVEDFVQRNWNRHPRPPALRGRGAPALFHGHCHQKALWGIGETVELLTRVCGDGLVTLPTGCCGMAGAFGYRQEHYDVSMNIFAQCEFDPIRQAGPQTLLLASGISCRDQIRHATGRQAIHPIQLLDQMLTDNMPAS